jgi:hypothetical protein
VGAEPGSGPFPGTAAYGNTVTGNTANDNGIAGISIHSHTPLQDMNGNVITGNHLSHDALHGGAGGGPGDSDAGVTHTTGILVLSATSPLTGTVITANTVSDVFYGVWMSARTPKANVSGNTIAFDAGGAAILVERTGTAPIVGVARTPSGHGYWAVDQAGGVFPFGDAGYFGSMGGAFLSRPVVGMAAGPSGAATGCWAAMVASSASGTHSSSARPGTCASSAPSSAFRPPAPGTATGSSPPMVASSASATPTSTDPRAERSERI